MECTYAIELGSMQLTLVQQLPKCIKSGVHISYVMRYTHYFSLG